eukprot:scaffold228764_cov29-Tisochrysis_lutea.AAC.1
MYAVAWASQPPACPRPRRRTHDQGPRQPCDSVPKRRSCYPQQGPPGYARVPLPAWPSHLRVRGGTSPPPCSSSRSVPRCQNRESQRSRAHAAGQGLALWHARGQKQWRLGIASTKRERRSELPLTAWPQKASRRSG